MAANSFGQIFTLTTFGESHGAAIGGIIDGCPAGIELDMAFIQSELDRRKPGTSPLASTRKEADKAEFLSGIFEGKTTGTPIGFLIRNTDHRSSDYEGLKEIYRPSHADYTYDKKYGFRDYRGGGRASARETVARVAAGAVAKLVLAKYNIDINAFVSQIGGVGIASELSDIGKENVERSPVRCPDPIASEKMLGLLKKLKKQGDSCGGIITCIVDNVPAGLGEPVFDKLQADLAKAMLSINAAKGFEYGYGFESANMKASELNDAFESMEGEIALKTNYSGGIQGGISNGAPIYFNVAFKPVPSIMQKQQTVNKQGKSVEYTGHGRHDPCVVPRAVPIVEAMAALVLTDHLLRQKRNLL